MDTTTSNDSGLRIVVKIGTSSLLTDAVNGQPSLNLVHIAQTVEVLAKLRNAGHDVVLVSSGAVGAGCFTLGMKERPSSLVTKQALASIGQVHLMAKYDVLFSSLGCRCAQVLLTYENFVDRVQFINARNTFEELFRLKAIPIVNENDSVGIHELKADNDKLAGMVGNMIGADVLFLMTDVNGVYTGNPRTDPNAVRIEYVDDFDVLRKKCKLGSGEDSEWGTGGMAAKIAAASMATSLGVRTVIMNADDARLISSFVKKEVAEMKKDNEKTGPLDKDRFDFGTTFERNLSPPQERKRWIRSLHRRGTITVDDGAKRALKQRKTLFAVGVRAVTGNFTELEAVSVMDLTGNEIGYGLSNFSSSDLKKVMGMRSEEIEEQYGQSGVAISRENMDVHLEKELDQNNITSDLNRKRADSMNSKNSSFTPPSKSPSSSSLHEL